MRSVMIEGHAHPAFVAADVEHAVRDHLAQLGIREVVNMHAFRLTFALPLSPVVLVRAHEFLLLRVHRNHRLSPLLETLDLRVDELELRIAVRVRRSLQVLAVSLLAVAKSMEQLRRGPSTDRMPL